MTAKTTPCFAHAHLEGVKLYHVPVLVEMPVTDIVLICHGLANLHHYLER